MRLTEANPELIKASIDPVAGRYEVGSGFASPCQPEEVQNRLRLLEQAIAASSAGIVISDANQPDRPIIYCNPAFEKITGYSPEEVLGRNCRFLQGEETDPTALAQIRASLQEGRDCQVVLKNYRKDGTTFWNELRISPVRDDRDRVTHFIGVQNDITDIKKAQQERDRFFTFSLDMLCVAGFDGYLKQVNPTWEKTLGFTKEELLAKPFIEFIHPADKESSLAQLRKLSAGINTVAFENRLLCKEGTYKWFLWNAIPIPDEGLCYAGGRDITEWKQLQEARQQAEAALRTSEAKFQKLAANIPGAIYQFILGEDGSMRFPYISSGCREIYELESEEIQQKVELILEQIHPDDREEFYDSVAISAQRLQPWRWEGRFINPSGKEKWIQAGSRPERLANGDIIWDGLLVDISDRKKAEEALRRSEEKLRQKAAELESTLSELQRTQTQLIQTEKMSSLGQMVAGIAHEINNPVSFIYSNLTPASEYLENLLHLIELYQQNYANPVPEIQQEIEAIDLDFLIADLPKMLSSMKAGADRIRQIVLSLRNFSRLDEAGMKLVDIHQGLDNTLLILQHRMKLNNGNLPIEVIKDYENLPPVECYAGQMNQVLVNIISNAIDALEQSTKYQLVGSKEEATELPSIRISTAFSPDGSRVAIRISDNGPGMTEETKMRLFDPFFTTKDVGKGTGLGLAISYQIVVEKHQGTLKCISELGKGAEFSIEIPIRQNKV